MHNHWTSVLVTFAVVGVVAAAATAQSRATGGDLAGTVRDQLQGAMVAVVVNVRNVFTGLERTAQTDNQGRFSIPLLPPGDYEVSVSSPGFTPRTQRVVIELGSVLSIDLVLMVAPTAESVNIVADNPAVELQRTAVTGLVTARQIQRLPINGRNFISFAAITPGVSFDNTPQQGASATSGLTFAGQRARSNNITVDGLDNNDGAAGGVKATFSQDSVREFQVLTNSFTAEFGNASGGVVNIVTKSGTNALDGAAFVFVRDDSLNAKGHFEKFSPSGRPLALAKAPYAQAQLGGTLGGPIRRDKAFFFGSYERLDVDASNLVTIDEETIITHPFLGTPLGTPAAILRRAGFDVETGNVGYKRRLDQFMIKTDHNLRNGHTFALRFHAVNTLDENVELFGGIVARSRGAALDANDYALAASHSGIMSSGWLNELRFQGSYRNQLVRALDPACGGPCLLADQGGPTVEVAGVASVGRHRFTPQNRRSINYQFLEIASFFRGTHAFKTGAELLIRDNRAVNSVLPLHFGGRYIFTALPSIPGVLPAPMTSIQALALGLPAAYVQGYGNDSEQLDGSDFAVFFQDDWKPKASITLRYGLRYQLQTWAGVLQHVNGYPATYSFPEDRNDFGPRVAVAWDVDGDAKTRMHAAYGLYYDRQLRALETIPVLIDGDRYVRTLAARFPNPLVGAAWNRPDHRLPESAAGAFPSLQFSVDPSMRTPYAHHVSIGLDRELSRGIRVSLQVLSARGYQQVGTIDYNPRVPSLGANRRPLDVNGVPDTSASVLQYTSYGESRYKGVVLAAEQRYANRYQFSASYTISKAEDMSTDFQSAFMPQQNGRGRDPGDPTGLPIAFDPLSERGPSSQDQRHRFVLSALVDLPASFSLSAIGSVASGRPYTILAGSDLNGDGDGGAFPSDRARRDPPTESSSVGRNSAVTPSQATLDLRISRRFRITEGTSLDALFEVFNLFNRTNYIETTNISPAFIFGTGAYPDQPLSTFGQFTQAGPPRQAQVGLRLSF